MACNSVTAYFLTERSAATAVVLNAILVPIILSLDISTTGHRQCSECADIGLMLVISAELSSASCKCCTVFQGSISWPVKWF